MADKQQENGVISEALPQSQAGVAVAAEPNSSEPKSDQNSSNTPQKEVSVQKETAKEPEKEAAPDVAVAPRSKPVMSKGEKVFNWVTYKGLNYWVNLGLSVVMADIAINGKGFWRKGLDYSISGTTKHVSNVLKSLSKNPNKEAIERMVHNNTRVGYESLSLLTGGSILLFPLKYLEDNKRKIVHWLNDKLGVDQTAPDGHKKTPEEIHIEKEQPKQSAGNLIKRRLLGTVSVVGAGFVLDKIFKQKTLLDPEIVDLGWTKINYDKKIQGGKNYIETTAFRHINNAVKFVTGGKGFKENGRIGRWTKLAILDSIFTVITASVMWVTSGAKKGKMPKEIDDSNDPEVLRDEMNRIVTSADVGDRGFAHRVEKRVQKLVESKNGSSAKGFVEALQHQEAPTVGVGV
ncbi:MAG: hypothetical protein AABY33_03220 [Pseudomonadota bacterium]